MKKTLFLKTLSMIAATAAAIIFRANCAAEDTISKSSDTVQQTSVFQSTGAAQQVSVSSSTAEGDTSISSAAVKPGLTEQTVRLIAAPITVPLNMIQTRVSKHLTPVMDSVHSSLSQRFLNTAQSLDTFISKSSSTIRNTSTVDLSVAENVREGSADTVVNVNMQLVLPHTENKLKLVVNHVSDELQDKFTTTESITEEQRRIAAGQTKTGTNIGIRYIFKIKSTLEDHIDFGVNYSPQLNHIFKPPQPYARTALSWAKTYRKWTFSDMVQAMWSNEPRMEVSGGSYADRKIQDNMTLSLAANALWKSDNANITIYDSISLPFSFSKKESITPSLQAKVISYPAISLQQYTFSLTYQRELYKQWLFLSISPAASYPKAMAFRFSPMVTFKINILFGMITG